MTETKSQKDLATNSYVTGETLVGRSFWPQSLLGLSDEMGAEQKRTRLVVFKLFFMLLLV